MHKYRTTAAANEILLKGQLALSAVESRGVRVDMEYLDGAIESTKEKIARKLRKLESGSVWRTWKRAFGDKANMGSRPQLAQVLYGELGYEPHGVTAGGDRLRTDKAALEKIDHPFVKRYAEAESLKKTLATNLLGIKRECVERDGHWWLHPTFHLNTVVSFRSSSSEPNWQNSPVRNPEIAELVRRCFLPRPGWHFGEVDFAQIEVRIAACYNNDPALVKYIKDKSTDMHRDQACKLFVLAADQVLKEVRHVSKNEWVFPQFYGSVYYQCAPGIWDTMERRKLTAGADGPPLRKWLARKGIAELGDCDPDGVRQNGTRPGTFVHHLKVLQEELWKTFAVYARWKQEWHAAYQRDGGMQSKMGFTWNIPLKRNEVVSYPIQGDAFMCCLWSLTKLERAMRRLKMRSLILGEVHDSIQVDVHPREADDVLDLFHKVMTEDLVREFDWVQVPIETESDLSPINQSWFDKKEVRRDSAGRWKWVKH
jgi:DNA polymerase I-like protein with 3'-5' exonuclease and polymerase domains